MARSPSTRGASSNRNFHDYRMLRINQTPKIEVHVVKSGEPPGGIGETGVNGGPPALRNAIYAATGVALRRLPIDRIADRRGEEGMRRAARHSGAARRGRRGGDRDRHLDHPRAWPAGLSPAARKVALADYRGTNPTGVPASLAKASLIERGEYLAKAADCMVCHTTPGRQGICRRPRLQAAVRHAVFDQHHGRQGNRHRQLQRSGFPERGSARQAPRRRDALSGDAVHVLHLHVR